MSGASLSIERLNQMRELSQRSPTNKPRDQVDCDAGILNLGKMAGRGHGLEMRAIERLGP
jgi:hypothetical protein